MGGSKSKLSIMSFEDAEKRITPTELNRLRQAFNQCSPKKLLSFEKFYSDVFGSFLPHLVADTIFKALNTSKNPLGITFKELLIGIIVITKGNFEEKCKFFFSLYCNESGTGIELSYIQYASDKNTSKEDMSSLRQYFDENFCLSFENFMVWIKEHPKFNEISRWLLTEEFHLPTLTNDCVPQDMYQLVAGVTHLDEYEIMELERTYHKLISISSNTFNLTGFTDLICPPLPEKIIERVFQTFDVNKDGVIDFYEWVCGISACCRGPKIERKKFCCKIFNREMNERFYAKDIEYIFQICEETKANETTDNIGRRSSLYSDLIKSIISSKEMMIKNYISLDDLLIWINDYDFLDPFLNLMNQICVMVFGLKPKNNFEEELMINLWLRREQKTKIFPYDHLFIINKSWINQWINSIRSNNSDKENFHKENHEKLVHSNSKISHSISMNNVLAFNRKHHYDFSKSNQTAVRKGSHDQITGRFIYHCPLDNFDDVFENIYPDISNIKDQINGRSNSVSSNLSKNILHDVPKGNKLGLNTNQNLLQFNCSKHSSNYVILSDDGGILSPNIKFNEDFYFLPPPIWNCFQSWYGMDIAIKRPVWIENRDKIMLNSEFDENCVVFKRYQYVVKVEIHLLTLFIMKHVLQSISSTTNDGRSFTQQNMPNTNLSGGSIYATGTVYKDIAATKRHVAFRASFSHKTRITDLIEFLSKKLRINREEMRIWKVVDENNLTLLDDEDKVLQELGLQNFDKILVEQRNIDLTWPEELNQLVTSKSLQNRKASVNKGVTGLSNIGNTCFFNSAIQCISNTNVLTDYFIRDFHLREINKNNIQGSQGIIALRYGELVKDLWAGSTNLIVPLKLKMTLDKFAKQFSGNQQHDAQELLSFLLDALHEDLNRITSKPSYKKLNDSNGRHDEEVAKEAWDAHVETNCSIIVDLFHGLLKSNVCCDVCKTNSVRFDAYSMLSLPIPMQLNQDFEILVFQNNCSTPVKHCVLLNSMDTNINFIRDQLAAQISTDPSYILLAYIEDNKIKRFLYNNEKIYVGQTIYSFIIDSRWSSKNGVSNKMDPHYQENLIKFIIYHRRMVHRANYFMTQSRIFPELFGYPIVFTIENENLKTLTNHDIHEKIIHILDSQIPNNVLPRKCNTIKYQSIATNSKPNHAIDCDKIADHKPFILSQVVSNIKQCNICHWTMFCHGCPLPNDTNLYKLTGPFKDEQYLTFDWSLTAAHFNFNSDNNKKFILDEKYKISKSINNQPMDLIKCIELFTTQETLDIDTPYQCDKCLKPQPAYKKLDLWTLPPIMIIHLKRFQFLDKRWQKSHKIVHFPIKNLDLSKFLKKDSNNNLSASKTTETLSGSQQFRSQTTYNLFAVNSHLGNLQMGHYITYARNKQTKKWYLFNDSICKEVDENEITSSCAYLLFYERADLDTDQFLNEILFQTHNAVPDEVGIIADEVESDIKKYCVIQ